MFEYAGDADDTTVKISGYYLPVHFDTITNAENYISENFFQQKGWKYIHNRTKAIIHVF